MNAQFIEPDETGIISHKQILTNIDLIMNKVELLSCKAIPAKSFPVYRTIQQFELRRFFMLFGLGQTALFRLAKSEHAKHLPLLIVIHCNGSYCERDDYPKIIGGKLFISHRFFHNWISSSDNEKLESDVLQILLTEIYIYSFYQN